MRTLRSSAADGVIGSGVRLCVNTWDLGGNGKAEIGYLTVDISLEILMQ